MSPVDGRRRRRWFAMPDEWPHDALGTRLQTEFGNEGLAVWPCVVAAAKRNINEGTFSFTTEEEAWRSLGVQPASFSLEEFFRVTGAQKETRKRLRGRVTDVTLSRWEELQQTISRQHEAERKARSRAKNTRDKGGTDSDSDSDSRGEQKSSTLFDDAVLIAEKKGARDPLKVALKIIAEDSEESIRGRARNLRGGPTYSEPNDPRTCPHHAVDTEGWCTACKSQIEEVVA